MTVASYFFGLVSIAIAAYFVYVTKTLIQKKTINIGKGFECINKEKIVKIFVIQSILYSLIFSFFGALIIVFQFPQLIFSIAIFIGAISWVISKNLKKYLRKKDN